MAPTSPTPGAATTTSAFFTSTWSGTRSVARVGMPRNTRAVVLRPEARPSLALPRRLALLQEGLHALLLVVRGEGEAERLLLDGEARLEVHLEALVDDLLRQAHGERAVGKDV